MINKDNRMNNIGEKKEKFQVSKSTKKYNITTVP